MKMRLPCYVSYVSYISYISYVSYVSYVSWSKLTLCYESFFGKLLPLIGTMKWRLINDLLRRNKF